MTPRLLSQEAFDAAVRYIETSARPLEIARLDAHFRGASVASVLACLDEYQNADGGFGHALEPDLRTPESSALCTTVAFQILRSLPSCPGNEIVPKGIDYFLRTLDAGSAWWRIIPGSAEQSPHAPWWDQTGREEIFDQFSLNPTAEILGYLLDSPRRVPDDILARVRERVVGHLSAAGEIEMHELLCGLRLTRTKGLPREERARLVASLARFVAATVALEPDAWREYSLRPLQVVESPDSPFRDGLEGAVAANLDHVVSSQSPDGSWRPTWTWGEAYPEDWKTACREWSGILTLEKLLILRRFGRIAGNEPEGRT